MKILDLTFDMEVGMPTCGTPWHENVKIEHIGKLNVVGRNTHSITMGSHTGTHMDAPLHFIDGARSIESTPLDILCGDITVVDLTHIKQGGVVTLDEVKKMDITERMLFRFDWWKNWKTHNYYKGFPYFEVEAVEYLLEKGVKMMAMDTPSPDDGSGINALDDSPNHKLLLKNDVIVVEYLTNTDMIDLSKKHKIVALPLKIKGSDGSPSRVILFEE